MNPEEIQALLKGVAEGTISAQEATERLKDGPLRRDELSFATLDHHRHLRQGLTEVVYGEGKTLEEILEIGQRLSAPGVPVLITRLNPEQTEGLRDAFPEGRFNARGRTCMLHPPLERGTEDGHPFVAVVSGGTADLPVAEEAAEVCVAMDVPVHRAYDVGVAGLHRILATVPKIRQAAAVVVVAGMEGALPSVVGGLVGAPVFAVPTSVGYGASFEGLAPLLAMLNSCAPGVMVSNIDNGFSAGVAAARVARAVATALGSGDPASTDPGISNHPASPSPGISNHPASSGPSVKEHP